jgi:hypothetical protein
MGNRFGPRVVGVLKNNCVLEETNLQLSLYSFYNILCNELNKRYNVSI